MRRFLLTLASCAVLAGCAATQREVRPAAPSSPWESRLAALQSAQTWQLAGRAAVALGAQGWQASLDWRQNGEESELHLAGPLGVGALTIKLTPAGVSLNGGPPSDAVVAQLQDRLGFDLPLGNLRYWLLGVPDPSLPFELKRNAQDRAAQLTQADWSIEYDDYLSSDGDLLPKRLVLTRADARVRIAVDHWTAPK
jgi:outer membrane lipoprotein LolB